MISKTEIPGAARSICKAVTSSTCVEVNWFEVFGNDVLIQNSGRCAADKYCQKLFLELLFISPFHSGFQIGSEFYHQVNLQQLLLFFKDYFYPQFFRFLSISDSPLNHYIVYRGIPSQVLFSGSNNSSRVKPDICTFLYFTQVETFPCK